jgi:hypothetical protein
MALFVSTLQHNGGVVASSREVVGCGNKCSTGVRTMVGDGAQSDKEALGAAGR